MHHDYKRQDVDGCDRVLGSARGPSDLLSSYVQAALADTVLYQMYHMAEASPSSCFNLSHLVSS